LCNLLINQFFSKIRDVNTFINSIPFTISHTHHTFHKQKPSRIERNNPLLLSNKLHNTSPWDLLIMNKSLISIALLLASSTVFAATEYPENPVLRPLTLTDGTIAISGALAWGEENNDSRGEVYLNAAYGLTDNLTLGFGGLNYRVLARPDNKTGLELAVGLGVRGYQDSNVNGDSVGYGADLNGKYVFDENIAMIFSLGYIKWDEEQLKNKDEYRYSVGFQANVAKDWTATTSYIYRDLKDFSQDDAHEVNVGLNYVYSKNTDIGVFAGYSSFDAQENSYKLDDNFERVAGVYATYRF
jgi:opacity protein-like surface antigen